MSTFEINKIVGAILAVLLVSTVIDMIGDALVPLEPPKAGVAAVPEVTTAKAPGVPTAKTTGAKTAEPASLAKLLAAADAAYHGGARCFRVHDVAEHRQLLDLLVAIDRA